MNGLIEETYAERILPWGKVNPFTARVSWEMEEEEKLLQENFHPSTRQINKQKRHIYIYKCGSLKLSGSFSKEKEILLHIAD